MQELVLIQPGRMLDGRFRTARLNAPGCTASLKPASRNAARWPSGLRRACCAMPRTPKMWRRKRCCAPTETLTACAMPRRFRAWLVRITFRLALDRWRSARRRELRETRMVACRSCGPRRRPPKKLPPRANSRRAWNARWRSCRKSSDWCCCWRPSQGYTLEEVAAMLGIPMGTVKSRLFFARKQLAEKLR